VDGETAASLRRLSPCHSSRRRTMSAVEEDGEWRNLLYTWTPVFGILRDSAPPIFRKNGERWGTHFRVVLANSNHHPPDAHWMLLC
jgi:hypothetical protein